VFGVFLTASIATQASPAEPALPTKAPTWVAPDAQRMFPLRKLDPRCTGEPPLNVSSRTESACDPDARVQPPALGRHAFDTNA
jgi:hypothetical protein